MRGNFAVLTFMLISSGCALMDHVGGRSPDQLARQERIRQEKLQEEQAYQARLEVMKPGVNLDDFLKAWGDPTSTEYYDGTLFISYLDQYDKPFVFGFKDNKLHEWRIDRVEVARKEQEEFRKKSLHLQKKQADAQETANTIQAIGNINQNLKNSQPKTTNCYKSGNQTTCRSY